jgi:MATE family, multidrug efflux pump
LKDLTQGSIASHLISMSFVMLFGMVGQTLYFLVDLYFVSHLGADAVAGVGAAGNLTFVVLALTQILAVGTVALISHAAGRKDQADANLVFNQSLLLAAACGAFTLIAGYTTAAPYLRLVGTDEGMQRAGVTFLYWFLPGLALQFASVAMSSALRGTGLVKPTMTVQLLSILVNVALAPVLIAGWGTGKPLGVAGAGLASTIAGIFGVTMLTFYFLKLEKYVAFHPDQWKPNFAYWKRILNIGLPAGAEFFIMFISLGLTYWLIRGFGAEAQAGYGISQRIMQAIFMPAMAVAFSVSPIAGQNFGARRADRVRETFRLAATFEVGLMIVVALLCHVAPASLIRVFSTNPNVIAFGTEYLQVISWSFIFSGFIFTCSGMFQALGNTWPALWSGIARLLIWAIPAVWMSRQANFELHNLWVLAVVTMAVQAVLSFWLIRSQMNKRLAAFATAPKTAAAA